MTTASSSPAPRRRPGGRTARTRAAVHEAVRSLLADGRTDLTVREIAELSGVHEVTIYRRWGSVETLVLDVATARLNEQAPFPDTGDLRDDLLTWAGAVASQLRRPDGFAFFRALTAAFSPALGDHADDDRLRSEDYVSSRVLELQRALDREAERGGSPPTAEMVLDLVLAPLYLRALWDYAPADDVEVLVDRALAAGRSSPGAGTPGPSGGRPRG
ncbi:MULTISPECIES: TetR-like C-terminal domain-containing protein [Streptomyces]|uniref:TetR-like C-terminal domain-containing protein n=1 Tax=Streptomyces TaxID=1883 RepID=UPI00068CA021|nr:MULTISPECIES: TetR-like C-terminal domain-containing protein [Streptomyces]NNG88742.1 TetR family transcriptional regulator [Streptomyces cacaoi]QHF95034.1 TetR family transcriptional regulator [Streptomyces sp. NHF165]